MTGSTPGSTRRLPGPRVPNNEKLLAQRCFTKTQLCLDDSSAQTGGDVTLRFTRPFPTNTTCPWQATAVPKHRRSTGRVQRQVRLPVRWERVLGVFVVNIDRARERINKLIYLFYFARSLVFPGWAVGYLVNFYGLEYMARLPVELA